MSKDLDHIGRRPSRYFRNSLRNNFDIDSCKARTNVQNIKQVADFMSREDVPLWHRGISSFQIDAADSLCAAIRDDLQQHTAYRVQRCLLNLGLLPAISQGKLRLALRFSKGNDLAFLWFVMEMFFRTPKEKTYSVNEQIIFSAIAHLDMVTTIRELNRILPPGHLSKRALALKEQQLNAKRQYAALVRAEADARKAKHYLPYFNHLERAIPKGIQLTIPKPDVQLKFFIYDKANDPLYKPPNERNRWYEEYKLKWRSRVATTTLYLFLDEFSEMIENYDQLANVEKHKSATQKIAHIKRLKVMCQHHKWQQEEHKLRKLEMHMMKRDRYKDTRRQCHLKKVQNTLQQLVDKANIFARAKFGLRGDHDNNVVVLSSKENVHEYIVSDADKENCDIMQDDNRKQSHTIFPHAKISKQKSVHLNCLGAHNLLKESIESNVMTNNDKCNTPGLQRQSAEVTKPATQNIRFHFDRYLRNTHIEPAGGNTTGYMAAYDYGHTNPVTPCSSQCYFKAPTANKPHKFDYAKIFEFKPEDETMKIIQETCVKALDGDGTQNVTKAAIQCAENHWQCSTQVADPKLATSPPPASLYPPDFPVRDFYDCNDKQLMHEMLRIALQHMRKNPKFVLASLPDSHKLPFLREWISQRYGQQYTMKQCRKQLASSVRVLGALEHIPLNAKPPLTDALGKNQQMDYSCREYIMNKARRIRSKYYNRCNMALMEQTRIFCIAYRAFFWRTGPPQNVFFSYLPSRIKEIHHRNPWKSKEYRNYYTYWLRRQGKEYEKNLQC